MSLTHADVNRILSIVDQFGDRNLQLEFGDLRVEISQEAARAGHMPRADASVTKHMPTIELGASAAQPLPVEQAVPEGMIAIRAPMVGAFYRAPSPGAAPFVEVGQVVKPDDTLFLIEVMKLFNSVKAGVAGTVVTIPAENGATVANRQLLMLIRPSTAP